MDCMIRKDSNDKFGSSLIIHKLPDKIQKWAICDQFSQCGKVIDVILTRNKFNKLIGIVKMQSPSAANRATAMFNNKPPMNWSVEILDSFEERSRKKEYYRMNDEMMKEIESEYNQRKQEFQDTVDAYRMFGEELIKCSDTTNRQQQEGYLSDVNRTEQLSTHDTSECEIVYDKRIHSIDPLPCVVCHTHTVNHCSVCKARYCCDQCFVNNWNVHALNCRKPTMPPLVSFPAHDVIPPTERPSTNNTHSDHRSVTTTTTHRYPDTCDSTHRQPNDSGTHDTTRMGRDLQANSKVGSSPRDKKSSMGSEHRSDRKPVGFPSESAYKPTSDHSNFNKERPRMNSNFQKPSTNVANNPRGDSSYNQASSSGDHHLSSNGVNTSNQPRRPQTDYFRQTDVAPRSDHNANRRNDIPTQRVDANRSQNSANCATNTHQQQHSNDGRNFSTYNSDNSIHRNRNDAFAKDTTRSYPSNQSRDKDVNASRINPINVNPVARPVNRDNAFGRDNHQSNQRFHQPNNSNGNTRPGNTHMATSNTGSTHCRDTVSSATSGDGLTSLRTAHGHTQQAAGVAVGARASTVSSVQEMRPEIFNHVPLPEDDFIPVRVSNISSESCLHVQLSAKITIYTRMETELQSYASQQTAGAIEQKFSKWCMASFEEKWYRAYITEKRAATCLVYFVDWGNLEEIENKFIHSLPDKFLHLRRLAVCVNVKRFAFAPESCEDFCIYLLQLQDSFVNIKVDRRYAASSQECAPVHIVADVELLDIIPSPCSISPKPLSDVAVTEPETSLLLPTMSPIGSSSKPSKDEDVITAPQDALLPSAISPLPTSFTSPTRCVKEIECDDLLSSIGKLDKLALNLRPISPADNESDARSARATGMHATAHVSARSPACDLLSAELVRLDSSRHAPAVTPPGVTAHADVIRLVDPFSSAGVRAQSDVTDHSAVDSAALVSAVGCDLTSVQRPASEWCVSTPDDCANRDHLETFDDLCIADESVFVNSSIGNYILDLLKTCQFSGGLKAHSSTQLLPKLSCLPLHVKSDTRHNLGEYLSRASVEHCISDFLLCFDRLQIGDVVLMKDNSLFERVLVVQMRPCFRVILLHSGLVRTYRYNSHFLCFWTLPDYLQVSSLPPSVVYAVPNTGHQSVALDAFTNSDVVIKGVGFINNGTFEANLLNIASGATLNILFYSIGYFLTAYLKNIKSTRMENNADAIFMDSAPKLDHCLKLKLPSPPDITVVGFRSHVRVTCLRSLQHVCACVNSAAMRQLRADMHACYSSSTRQCVSAVCCEQLCRGDTLAVHYCHVFAVVPPIDTASACDWHRAVVMETGKDGDWLKLNLVDYAICVNVQSSTPLRFLEERFANVPIMGISFALYDLSDKQLNENQLEFLSKRAVNTNFEMHVKQVKNGLAHAVLLTDTYNFNDRAFSYLGQGNKPQPDVKLMELSENISGLNVAQLSPPDKHTARDVVRNTHDQSASTKQDKAETVYTVTDLPAADSINLSFNSEISVLVTEYCDYNYILAVPITDHTIELNERLEMKLAKLSAPNSMQIDKICDGILVLVRYRISPEVDESLHRAQIVQIIDSKSTCNIFLIDLGKFGSVTCANIFHLPNALLCIPPLSIHIMFSGSRSDSSIKQKWKKCLTGLSDNGEVLQVIISAYDREDTVFTAASNTLINL